MKVPFLDVGAAYRALAGEIDAAIAGVHASGVYIGGDFVSGFEHEFAEYVGAGACVGVGNGLDALVLSLRCLGIGPGDEVIVPANTFIASWLAISAVGATPVPVEPDPKTMNLDISRLNSLITPATRAIMPVHLYGHPADLDPVLEIASTHGLYVVEDAAQAHGARYRGRPVGAHGDLVCWSFYPAKNLGAMGDGGAVTTDRPELAEKIRVLANYGSSAKYRHEVLGVNSRLDPIQAAALSVKLKHLDAWNRRRSEIADRYLEELNGSVFSLPEPQPWADPVWHLFVVQHPQRDAVAARLQAQGVSTQVHYPMPPYRQVAYRGTSFERLALPVSDELHRTVLSLPIGPHMSAAQVHAVVVACRAL